jgi:uncharacterized protein
VPKWLSAPDIDLLRADGWQPAPFQEFILKVHSRCDLSCRYCYMYEMADQSWRAQPKRMSRDTVGQACERIAEHAQNHGLPAVRLVLHGGEPLLAGPDLLTFAVTRLRSVLGPGITGNVVIQTNGVLLDAAYLKIFTDLDVKVGVSLDGDAGAHDRHRRRANGQGSYSAVVAGLEYLTSPLFRHLFSGLLCTIDPRNPPVDTYEALRRFAPPRIDFLLPHGNWTAPPPGRLDGSKQTPYGDWLITVFDRWFYTDRHETDVRMFTAILNLLFGRPSHTETLGTSPIGVVVIETDGSVEQTDNLKSAYQGATATGLHVRTDSFDRALLLPGVVARQIGERALCDTCLECPIHRVCGAGLYAHRYRAENGFDNPSVYCEDLKRLIYHVRRVVQAQVDGLRQQQ